MKKLLASIILQVLLTCASALFESCSQSYTLTSNNPSMTINSPNYPNAQYPQGSSCLYYFKAPSGYSIQLSCYVNLAQPNGACSTEYFYIATDGNKQLAGSEYFCGAGNVARTSIFNEISFGYSSSASQSGAQTGYFTCTATMQAAPCDCGWSVNSKVVGGTVTSPNQFVSMTGIVYVPGGLVFCGGSIIHYRFVLTAAHCFVLYNTASQLAALVGDQDYTIGTDTPYSYLYYVQSIIRHPSYNSITQKNDIALLQTTTDITWNRGVGPACLPFKYPGSNFAGSTLDLAGWGTTSFGGQASKTLRVVTLNVQTNSYCTPYYVNIDNTQMCTYTSGKDSCLYDSGGSLYFRPNNRLYTIGIVSYGGACASTTPTVNTKVSAYLSWIQQATGVTFCNK